MPTTNFPNGATSYGIPLFGQGTLYDMPCGRAWFVCNRAGVTNGDGTSRDRPLTSIADAIVQIATTNATLNDYVFVLSGHAENVPASNVFSASLVNTGAVTIPAGTRIIGEGEGTNRPVLTFTAAGSTLAFAAAGISLENFVLLCPQSGVTTVAAFVTITAANCGVIGCNMQVASSATALITTAVSLSSAATEAQVTDCLAWGLTGAPTSWVSTTGTAGPKRVYILRNFAKFILSAATGAMIDVSANSVTPPVDWLIAWNTMGNDATNSTVVIKGAAGCTGMLFNNGLGLTNATGAATAVNTPGNWWMIENYATVPGKAGLIVGTVSG